MWWQYVPNVLTLSRFPLGALYWYFHIRGHSGVALVCAYLACLTDYFDGYLARRWDCVSNFGQALDPYADKWAYWSILIVSFASSGVHTALYPFLIVMLMYEVGLGLARFVFGRQEIKTNVFAKKRAALVMILGLTLYTGFVLGQKQLLYAQQAAILIGYAAIWYAVRSVVTYTRDYGGAAYIPRPLHLL